MCVNIQCDMNRNQLALSIVVRHKRLQYQKSRCEYGYDSQKVTEALQRRYRCHGRRSTALNELIHSVAIDFNLE